ncbi:MAG: hypothetical protein ACRDPT_15360 [Streptomycetales bacterium]
MGSISIELVGTHQYVVVISGSDRGGRTTRHAVTVPGALLEDLGDAAADEAALVRESFMFLLEREPASAILKAFSLDVISTYFPEYVSEMRRRVGDG